MYALPGVGCVCVCVRGLGWLKKNIDKETATGDQFSFLNDFSREIKI